MESQRSFLVIGLLLVSFLLWQQWQIDYGPKPVAQVSEQPMGSMASDAPSSDAPSSSADVPASSEVQNGIPLTSGSNSAQLISVQTDTFDMLIDPSGGDVVSAKLRQYPITQGADDAITILSNDPDTLYEAQTGLIGRSGPDGQPQRPIYQTQSTRFSMQAGETLRVPLVWSDDGKLQITKTFVFEPNSHAIKVEYSINNLSADNAQVQLFAQLKQTINQPKGNMFMPTYRGAAYSTAEERYKKFDFDDFEDDRLAQQTNGGWVAMIEHYFVSAWVPGQSETNTLYSRLLSNQYAAIGYKGQTIDIAPGATSTLETTLYVGPKDQETLANLAKGLDLTVDYGILWWLSQPLFSLLSYIYSLVNNWGLAIIVITIIVKTAMFWLTKKQYESMAKLRALQPKMQALKDRYGDDRQKMSQGMMELYKKEKVNPMGGCFPLLLQMPIFLALYWVLLESVELRHADFFLWITDLSVMDPYLVLPALTGLSMYLLQKLQPMTIQDPMQQKIFQWMPVAMSIFFIWFPAGLVLYWLVSNVITLIQAKLIYASMEKRGIKIS